MAETVLAASALNVKYRPKTLDQVVGQPEAVSIVKGFLARKQVPSTILITGSCGVGKTTLARIIATEINEGITDDIIEINVGSERSIDSIRELAENCRFKPMRGRFKCYVMDEVHALQGVAASALLKVVEEPPAHVVFILCTSEPDKILKAAKQRGRHIVLNDIVQVEDLETLILRVCKGEKVKLDPKTITKIAKAASGAPRECLQILANVIDIQASNGGKVDDVVITQALKQLDISSDQVAMKTLLSIYCSSLVSAMRCMNDNGPNFRGLLNSMHLMAWGVVSDVSNSGIINWPQKQFLEILHKKRPEIALEQAVEIYAMLSDLKTKMVYGVPDEKAIVIAGIGQYLLSKKKRSE